MGEATIDHNPLDHAGSESERDKMRPQHEGDDYLTKEWATRLLRQFHGVPRDFQATFVARSDPNVIRNARKTLKLDKMMAALSLIMLPFAAPLYVYLLRKEMKTISEKLTDGAEDDIYIVGSKGYATLNNGHLKAWTAMEGMVLEPDTEMFATASGCLCMTVVKQQTVLAVNELGTGQYRQLWFINPRTQRLLASKYLFRQPKPLEIL